MKKKYFTEEEKRQARLEWHRKDYHKHREKRIQENRERCKINRDRYNKNRMKKYYEKCKNPLFREQENKRNKDIRNKERIKVIEHYSNGKNCCSICGINDMDVLTVDHVNGGGNQERKNTTHHTCRYLIRSGYPKGYRILCMNCNMKEAKKNKLYGTHKFIDNTK